MEKTNPKSGVKDRTEIAKAMAALKSVVVAVKGPTRKQKLAAYEPEDESKFEFTGSLVLLNSFSFGWTEDGRCSLDVDIKNQKCPRHVVFPDDTDGRHFVCKNASAGSRHTLYLMINSNPEPVRKTKKLMISGLNQRGLCEEPGFETAVEIPFHPDEEPVSIVAGNGNSFVVSRFGNLFSFGNGNFGILGHGDCESCQIPRQVMSLLRVRIRKVAAGGYHAVALTYGKESARMYSWGRNKEGQLGRGFESKEELTPELVTYFQEKEYPLDVSCGYFGTMALIETSLPVSKDSAQPSSKVSVFCWGDNSRGQLGSGDTHNRSRPQENRWLSKYCTKRNVTVAEVCCGGFHNLVLLEGMGQVISWGAGESGQLGHGNQFDNPKPRIINDLKGVVCLSAGLRHSMAIVKTPEALDVVGWGFNSYGELGLGDLDLRIQPTRMTAMARGRLLSVSCGDRHSVVVTNHIPLKVKEDRSIKPYLAALEAGLNSNRLKAQLQRIMTRNGLNPALLETPDAYIEKQPGEKKGYLLNEQYDKGLRYCMDSFPNPVDWRRKSYECCFMVPALHLWSVCLACARNCVAKYGPRPFIRQKRHVGKYVCECRKSKNCLCSWSKIRAEYDKLIDEDFYIGPRTLRQLLINLRAPAPMDKEELEECLVSLAEGDENTDLPRIKPTAFEKWYRKFYDEYEDEDDVG